MGSLLAAKFTNRCGGNPPGSAGVLSVVSTSAADTGILRVAYKTGAAWVAAYEAITLAGLTPVTGTASLDSGTEWVAIYSGGTAPTGDIYISVNSVVIGVIYGTASGYPNWCASTLYTLAVATGEGVTVSGATRVHATVTGVGSFSRATYWPGNDSAIALPGAVDFDAGDEWGYVVKLTIPANLPKPPNGQIACDIDLIGDPSSVVDADFTYYPGADGNPTNDTDPYGGAIDTGAEIVEATANTLIASITIAGTEKIYRGAAYRVNES